VRAKGCGFGGPSGDTSSASDEMNRRYGSKKIGGRVKLSFPIQFNSIWLLFTVMAIKELKIDGSEQIL